MPTETLVSPGVLLQEIDRTYVQPGTDPSGMAIIGPTARGPLEIPTLITNYQDFKTTFGTVIKSGSQAYELYTNLAVKNYFDNGGSSALVVRVAPDASGFAHASSSNITAISSSNHGGTTYDNPFVLTALGKGSDLNSATGTKSNFKYEITNVNEKAGTFSVLIRRGDDTNSKPLVLEQFNNVSLDPLSPNYIAKNIGDQSQTVTESGGVFSVTVDGEFPNRSKFVRVSAVNNPTYRYLAADGSVATRSSDGIAYNKLLPQTGSGTFVGGLGDNFGSVAAIYGSQSSATNIQGLHPNDYTASLSILTNREEFKFKTLVTPGLTHDLHGTQVDLAISNTETRGDNLYVADLVAYGETVANAKIEAEEIDSSFAASYWPWVQVRSAELGKNVWAPASTIIPGVFAKNDSIAAPWFAPAGLTRGGLRNVPKVETKLSKTQRDDLYTSKVNPLATFPGQGVVVFGQKTLQQAASALDRVNVRRLLLDVKDTINGFARKIVFEQNTDATRDRFKRQITPYLENLVSRQGLYAFQVKIDGQLNTPEVIDQNKLVGQVFLQPTKTAEFIALDFTITPTGASFED
jgi:phage tail sheath protein FI